MGSPMENVALFIDLDNLRIGFEQSYGCQLRPRDLMDAARAYGTVVVARAYADYGAGDLRLLRDKLTAAGIDDVDVPSRMVNGRPKSYVDFYLLMDIYDTLLDRADVTTFVLATGDDHFTRISAKLRNRHGKRVIVFGVPGSISQRLRESADAVVELQAPAEALPTEDDVLEVVRGLVRRLPYVTRKYVVDTLLATHPSLTPSTAHQLVARLLGDGRLVLEMADTADGPRNVLKLSEAPGSPAAGAPAP